MKRYLILTVLLTCVIDAQDFSSPGPRTVSDNPYKGILLWPDTMKEAAKITRARRREFLLTLGYDHPNGPEAAIQDTRFAVLQTGKVHLLAAIDTGGTMGTNEIAILYCDQARCKKDVLFSNGVNLSQQIMSLSGDGVNQILVETIGFANVSELYEIQDTGPVKVNQKYPALFRDRVVPDLEERRAGLLAIDPAVYGDSERLSVQIAGVAFALDMARIDSGESDELFWQHATDWAKSDKDFINQFAIEALKLDPRNKRAAPVWAALNRPGKTPISEQDLKPLPEIMVLPKEIQ